MFKVNENVPPVLLLLVLHVTLQRNTLKDEHVNIFDFCIGQTVVLHGLVYLWYLQLPGSVLDFKDAFNYTNSEERMIYNSFAVAFYLPRVECAVESSSRSNQSNPEDLPSMTKHPVTRNRLRGGSANHRAILQGAAQIYSLSRCWQSCSGGHKHGSTKK